jgi:hypothetical protein
VNNQEKNKKEEETEINLNLKRGQVSSPLRMTGSLTSSPGWPQTCDPSASTFQVLGLQVWITMLSEKFS